RDGALAVVVGEEPLGPPEIDEGLLRALAGPAARPLRVQGLAGVDQLALRRGPLLRGGFLIRSSLLAAALRARRCRVRSGRGALGALGPRRLGRCRLGRCRLAGRTLRLLRSHETRSEERRV